MAVPVSIHALLNKNIVESSRIEFKEGYNPSRIIRTICAFANDVDNIGGGYLVIGIEEKNGVPQFPPKGLQHEEIDDIQKKLLNHCSKIQPRYIPECEPVQYQGQNLLLIWAKAGYGRPYRAPETVEARDSSYYYYIRKLASTIRANEQDLKDLYAVSQSIPFDDQPNLAASLHDLDKELLLAHLKEAESSMYAAAKNMTIEEIARNMQLVSGPPEMEKPVNAALLFFCPTPEKFFRYTQIEVVYIPDPTGTGMEERIFQGPVQNQLRNALQYIQNTILTEKVIKQTDKAEAIRIWNYPYRSLEEILSNAVYHRSYQTREPITVRITASQIEITSHPGFDISIKDSDVKRYRIRARSYRNRRLGDLLKEIHLIEGRNTGFPNALSALKKNGSASLQFEYDEDRNYLSVIIPVHPAFFTGTNKSRKTEAYQESILKTLSEKPMTLTSLAKAMGYRGITKRLRTNVDILIESQRIVYMAGDRGEVLLSIPI